MKTTRKQFIFSIAGALMGRKLIHKPRGPGITTLVEAINEGVNPTWDGTVKAWQPTSVQAILLKSQQCGLTAITAEQLSERFYLAKR